jgi:CotS family spore coat protein
VYFLRDKSLLVNFFDAGKNSTFLGIKKCIFESTLFDFVLLQPTKGMLVKMANLNSEPLDKVLSNYDFKVLSIRNESYKDKKGVWWIQTDTGYKILKKVSNSEATLKYILQTVQYLIKNGINLPEVVLNKAGKEYTVCEGNCFVVLEAIEGKNPNYSSDSELSKIVTELARFHRASKGFSPSNDSKPKLHLGTWVSDYEEQINDLNSYYENEVFLNENKEIGSLIKKEFPYFYKRAACAIEGLKGKDYKDWVELIQKTGCLCHQDFAAGNLLLTPSGKLYVIDTDSITIDIPARDIRKLLNKIMKKSGKWDVALAKKILHYYQAANPLTPSQWNVVKMDLLFPHLFIGAMNKYCYKRDLEWDSGKYFKRIKEMAEFEKTVSPILDKFDEIIPL